MHIPPFKLERYFARYEFSAPYLLSSSDCESLTLSELLSLEPGAADELGRLWLGYTESAGGPALRQAIASLYGQVQPEQVLVHSGAQEAIFNFMNACLQPGDHVIVHWPCYQSLFEVAHSIGCQVTRWEARPANGWALDLDELRASLRPNTKVVVINCPHNPTGYMMERTTLRELSRLSQERGFVIFSDEVYRFLEREPDGSLPAFCDVDERAVSLGVMSKSFGLAGLRIGWVASRNREVYERMAAFKDYTTICSSAASEFLAAVALRQRAPILARNRQIIAHNLALLADFFARQRDRFEWQLPQAGPVAFPALAGGQDSEPFCQQLVDEAGVLLLPGSLFDEAYRAHFRLGFGRKNLPDCLQQLERFLVSFSR